MERRVAIVGAGLAGLTCARILHQAGIPVEVYEASDGIGGRVRTDEVEGFLLDRGFQVLLQAYPEAQALLDYDALELHAFQPGALVRYRGGFHRVADPWRLGMEALEGVFTPIGTLADKFRLAVLRKKYLGKDTDTILEEPEQQTIDLLRNEDFSEAMIDRFFRPFFGGILLDEELASSSRMFGFVFQMMAKGDTVIPARGMQAIPEQLAASLGPGAIHLNHRVSRVEGTTLCFAHGLQVQASALVVATEGFEAARLVPSLRDPGSKGVAAYYYEVPESPVRQPMLVLNGDGSGPINNLACLSQVCPHYAPPGRHLVSVSVLNVAPGSEDKVRTAVETQLHDWYGDVVQRWRFLRWYNIEHAQPRSVAFSGIADLDAARTSDPVFICGDHRFTASINGAMASGRAAARAVLREFSGQ